MVPRLLALAATLALSVPAAAHPGHGDPSLGNGWVHLLAEPRHALALMAAIALCAAIFGVEKRRRAALRAALREARIR
jgi:hydrogenase/urease accessory protein HupE